MRALDILAQASDIERLADLLTEQGFSPIGEGHHALVYGSPNEPDVVVRAANAFDGFLVWADAISALEARPAWAPRIDALKFLEEGCYAAVVERLVALPDDAPARSSEMPGLLDAVAHAQSHASRVYGHRVQVDPRRENVMARSTGGAPDALVLNDPHGRCLTEDEALSLLHIVRIPMAAESQARVQASSPSGPK